MNKDIIKEFETALSVARVIQSGQKLSDACVDYFGHWQGNATATLYPESTAQELRGQWPHT